MEKFYTKELSCHVKKRVVLLSFFLGSISSLKSQTPITAATVNYLPASTGTTYVANGAPGSPIAANTYTYTYGNLSGTTNNDLQIDSYDAGGTTYFYYPVNNSVVRMRRVDNALVTGVRNLKFDEGTVSGANVNITGTYDDNMENFFNKNNGFNSGTDNLFANLNDGNGNYNNIERVDVIFPTGTFATDNSKAGFAIFERGATAAHDPVKAALILGLDGSGLPTSYSSILSITSVNYAGTDVVAPKAYVIARRDNAIDLQLMVSTTTNQPIGGVLFKYSDFGIANGTPVYGYSLFATDFTGTPAQAVDYTDGIFFPTTTDGATGAGGIDLVAFTGVAQSEPVLTVLPIELLSFTVTEVNGQPLLQWSTASEQNSSHFDIERSADGSLYTRLGEVPAAVNSVATLNYQYPDDLSSLSAELVYYRIKLVDLDNTFTYSPVVTFKRNNKITDLKVYPQPLTQQTYIEVGKADYYNMKLVNSEGRIVQQWSRVFISSQQPLNIFDKKMSSGIYYLQLINIKTGARQQAKVICVNPG